MQTEIYQEKAVLVGLITQNQKEDKAKEYFELVEKKRGHLAAQRLRDDVRAEWKKRRVEMAGQA
jgi:hypothetical protein